MQIYKDFPYQQKDGYIYLVSMNINSPEQRVIQEIHAFFIIENLYLRV